jgi:hypothetical protein
MHVNRVEVKTYNSLYAFVEVLCDTSHERPQQTRSLILYAQLHPTATDDDEIYEYDRHRHLQTNVNVDRQRRPQKTP